MDAALKSKVNQGVLKLRKGDPVNELMADELESMERDRKTALKECRALLKEEQKNPTAFAENDEKVAAREECVSLLGAKKIGE